MKTIEDLKKEQDIMAIFRDFDLLKQYVRTVGDLVNAMEECLDDNQKLEVIHLDYFKRLKPLARSSAIMTIQDENIKAQMIQDDELMELAFTNQYGFMQFVETLNDESKLYVLSNPELLQKFQIEKYNIKSIIKSMTSKGKAQVLSNRELLTEMRDYEIVDFIIGVEDDKLKAKFCQEYELSEYYVVEVIKSFSDENKRVVILEDDESLTDWRIIDIISTFGIDAMIDFINNEQKFLQNKDIKLFKIMQEMKYDKQLEFIKRIDEINLSEAEIRRVYAALKNEAKQEIDLNKIDEKYREILEIETSAGGRIRPKLNGNLHIYKDLDELIYINPMEFEDDTSRQALVELIKICPNMSIRDELGIGDSTCEEYLKGEEWVNNVIQGINPEWTDIQKLAYIDTAIGKKISYTPEWDTEVQDHEDARALWRIITTGYGICNGIAQVEQYLLSRIGIEAELAHGKKHSFVKVKNIEIPTQDGIVQGDTLLDPTWNLAASRYGAMPMHFCKSYEELRKFDIDAEGLDRECHKSEDLEESQTINLDIEFLRDAYKNIGIADKYGKFPIAKLIDQAREIDKTSTDMQSKISRKFEVLKTWCPEFAICQNSTIKVLKDVLFECNENFNFEKCVASRVYDKSDPKKKAVLYIYMELAEQGKLFFYADKSSGEFAQLSQEEFEAKFECYEKDIEKMPDGKRPWESSEKLQEEMTQSSGEIIAEEGR